MLGLRWHERNDIRVETVPNPPEPKEGWVQIKIRACGICGSDVHEYEDGPIALYKKRAPLILGHEFTGVIEKLGPNTGDLSIGTKVVIAPVITCKGCYYCKNGLEPHCRNKEALGLTIDGGFAEYVNVPMENCYPVSEDVPSELLALAEPMGVALHAVNRSKLTSQDEALVIGGGPIGLMLLKILQLRGVKNVGLIEPVENRRNLAKDLGAHYVIDPNGNMRTEVLEKTSGIGPSVVYECVGSTPTYQFALDITRKNGRFVVVGSSAKPTAINLREVLRGEKEIIGSLGGFYEWQEVIDLIVKNKDTWKCLITEKIALEEAEKAIKRLSKDRSSYVKIMVSLAD